MKYKSKAEREARPGNSSSFGVILSLILEPLHITAVKVLQGVKLGFPHLRPHLLAEGCIIKPFHPQSWLIDELLLPPHSDWPCWVCPNSGKGIYIESYQNGFRDQMQI